VRCPDPHDLFDQELDIGFDRDEFDALGITSSIIYRKGGDRLA